MEEALLHSIDAATTMYIIWDLIYNLFYLSVTNPTLPDPYLRKQTQNFRISWKADPSPIQSITIPPQTIVNKVKEDKPCFCTTQQRRGIGSLWCQTIRGLSEGSQQAHCRPTSSYKAVRNEYEGRGTALFMEYEDVGLGNRLACFSTCWNYILWEYMSQHLEIQYMLSTTTIVM